MRFCVLCWFFLMMCGVCGGFEWFCVDVVYCVDELFVVIVCVDVCVEIGVDDCVDDIDDFVC